MPDILHRVAIKSSPNETYRALTTREGLAGWWTTDTQGHCNVGGVIKFRFEPRGFFDMKVLELDPGNRVLWQVVDGPAEWIGTKIRFDLNQEGDWTIILFKHQDWKEPMEFMHHCSTKWAVFLLSLKVARRDRQGRSLSKRHQDRQLELTRIIHQWFYCNDRFATVTSRHTKSVANNLSEPR